MKYGVVTLVGLMVALLYHQYSKPTINTLVETYTLKPTFDVIFNIPIYLYTDEFVLPDLIPATEIQLKTELSKIKDEELVNFKFDLRLGGNNRTTNEVDKFVESAHAIEFKLRDIELLFNMPTEKVSEFLFKENTIFNNDFPYFLTQTIIHQIFNDELARYKIDQFTKDEYGLKFVNDDDDELRNITLNINLYPGVELDLLKESFTDLQKLYNVQFTSTDDIESLQHNFFNFNIYQNDTSQIVVRGNTVDISYQRDEEILNSQIAYDIKDALFPMLNFVENPQIVPLQIDIELRFQIVRNLLRFIRDLNKHRHDLTDPHIIELFQLRNKILQLVKDYDWEQLYRLSQELVQNV